MTRNGTYTSSRWRSVRAKVLDRDNRRCQACGRTNGLHVHHIKPAREFEEVEDAHFEANLVTLCKYCHPEWEGRDERPELASTEAGVSIQEIADRMAYSTVYRTALAEAVPEIYWRWLVANPGRCSACFRKTGPEALFPANTFREVLWAAATRRGADLPEKATPDPEVSYCTECDGTSYKWRPPAQIRSEIVQRLVSILTKSGLDVSLEALQDFYGDGMDVFEGQLTQAKSIQQGLQVATEASTSIVPEGELGQYVPEATIDETNRTEDQVEYLQWYKESVGDDV